MNRAKKEKLIRAGFRVAGTKEFLGLSDEEMALIELKRSLIRMLKDTREANAVTQSELAKMISSSQSRVAKMEAASADVSLDLILRALFALGLTRKQVGRELLR